MYYTKPFLLIAKLANRLLYIRSDDIGFSFFSRNRSDDIGDVQKLHDSQITLVYETDL